jgi:hypothetical protein
MRQIADWLEKLGMSEYAQRFAESRIDFKYVLLNLLQLPLAGAILTVAGQQLHAQRDRFGLELT